MWGAIKPDVVEYGGDFAYDSGAPPQLSILSDAAPELVRSTMGSMGPAFSKDAVGTSFSTPKVTRIAAHLENYFPDEPALLYRSYRQIALLKLPSPSLPLLRVRNMF